MRVAVTAGTLVSWIKLGSTGLTFRVYQCLVLPVMSCWAVTLHSHSNKLYQFIIGPLLRMVTRSSHSSVLRISGQFVRCLWRHSRLTKPPPCCRLQQTCPTLPLTMNWIVWYVLILCYVAFRFYQDCVHSLQEVSIQRKKETSLLFFECSILFELLIDISKDFFYF